MTAVPSLCPSISSGKLQGFALRQVRSGQVRLRLSKGGTSRPLRVSAVIATPVLLSCLPLPSICVCAVQVIVERAAEARENDHAKKVQQKEAERAKSMENLVVLCAGMDINANGMISYQELLKGYDKLDDFQALMDVMDITRTDLESIFYVLDENASGEVSYLEFCSSLGHFFKREPIIMHSLVRYSVMEIRSSPGLSISSHPKTPGSTESFGTQCLAVKIMALQFQESGCLNLCKHFPKLQGLTHGTQILKIIRHSNQSLSFSFTGTSKLCQV